MTATRVQTKTPITNHLWALGFTIKAKADRLPVEIADGEGNSFKTNFEITALPERGEARRHFGAKGPARSLEHFLAEREQGTTTLKDLYTEQCARHLFEMLKAQAPTLSKPAVST